MIEIFYLDKTLKKAELKDIIYRIQYLTAAHSELPIDSGLLIKESKKRKVFKINNMLVKARKSDLFRDYSLKKEFSNSFRLKKLGINTPEPCLISKDKKGRMFFIGFKFIDGAISSDNYFFTKIKDSKEKKIFISQLAVFVKKIHDNGVFHKDLKCANILVRKILDKRFQFFLIDNGRIIFRKKIKEKDRVFNLAQIKASFIGKITDEEWKLFLDVYAK